MKRLSIAVLLLSFSVTLAAAGVKPLQMSVYATADDVLRYMSTPEAREQTAAKLTAMHITGVFLEGRRGDTYVSAAQMKPVRDFFVAKGFRVTGGVATVPGKEWGVRQNGPYGWLNYQAERTQKQIQEFFRENATVFDEIIIDDFYCSEDTSPESEKARGNRSWGEYRRDLLVGLLKPMIFDPAQASRPDVKLILKYPQWYDRFHLFGYEPSRMSAPFNRIWVGTEVRNPKTKRMGYVQPFESFVNFRWIQSVAGPKVFGAWFDHIECTPQNFIDQAWQSMLAGAQELTLFNLGNVMQDDPANTLLARDWNALVATSSQIRTLPLGGVPVYKPVNGDSNDNMWLMDNLGMLGIPVKPVAAYPADAKVVILGVQASGDPKIASKIRASLAGGATVVLTPAMLRKLGRDGIRLAGASVAAETESVLATEVNGVTLTRPLQIDRSLKAEKNVALWAVSGGERVPYLVSTKNGPGTVLTWNVRTFNEADYQKTNERLLAPEELGLPYLPQEVTDTVRNRILAPQGMEVSAPTGVACYRFGSRVYFYNFLDRGVEVKLNGKPLHVPANALVWTVKPPSAGSPAGSAPAAKKP